MMNKPIPDQPEPNVTEIREGGGELPLIVKSAVAWFRTVAIAVLAIWNDFAGAYRVKVSNDNKEKRQ